MKPITPEPNKGGRPRKVEPSVSVCTRVGASQYAVLVKAAQQRDQSVSSLVRDLLHLKLPAAL